MMWEYKIHCFGLLTCQADREMLRDVLNDFGKEGWELVTIVGTCAYLKRPLHL